MAIIHESLWDKPARRAQAVAELMRAKGLSRAQVAGVLHLSEHTVKSWYSTTARRRICPSWAVELLAYKTLPPEHALGFLAMAAPFLGDEDEGQTYQQERDADSRKKAK